MHLVKFKQLTVKSFTETEIKLILTNISDYNLKNIILFAWYTGCRLNDILNVQWKDITFGERILRIYNKDISHSTGNDREILISNNLLKLLYEMLLHEPNENIYYFYNPEYYIFANSNKNLTIKFVSMKFKKVLRKLNFPENYHFQ